MNLSQFRTRVARVSGMSSSDTTDTDLIDAWANDAVEQFLRDTKLNKRTATLAVTAGTGDYTLDTDIISFEDLWIEPANSSDQQRLLERRSSADIRQMRIFEAAEDVSSMYYALDGEHLLMLYPAPVSSSDELHMVYVPKPTSTLSATADTPASTAYGNIPTKYHPVLESYVKWKACEAEEHRPSDNGLSFQAEYERGVAKVRADLSRRSGIMASPAKWGRRNKRIPTRPGIDLG